MPGLNRVEELYTLTPQIYSPASVRRFTRALHNAQSQKLKNSPVFTLSAFAWKLMSEVDDEVL